MNMKKIVFVVLLLVISPVNVMAIGIGLKTEIAGGPVLSVVGMTTLHNKLSLNLSVGGFPGIILRVEPNLRLSTEKKWLSYIQGGIGYWRGFRGKAENKNLVDIHFNAGISKSLSSSLILSADIGLIYVPHWINPAFIRELSGVIPIVPMISLEIVYYIH